MRVSSLRIVCLLSTAAWIAHAETARAQPPPPATPTQPTPAPQPTPPATPSPVDVAAKSEACPATDGAMAYDAFMKGNSVFHVLWNDATNSVKADRQISVRFYRDGQPITADAAAFKAVRFLDNDNNKELLALNLDTLSPIEKRNYLKRYCIPLASRDNDLSPVVPYRQGHLFRLEVTVGEQVEPLYSRRLNMVDPYGVDPFNTGTVGLWVPVGLLGTNFHTTADGIELTAVPVGVAIGTKWWAKKDFYLGVSALLTWSISSTEQTRPNPTTGMDEKVSVTLAKSAGAGVMFDIDGWLYLGGLYNKSFRDDVASPGWFAVLGVGPELIQFFANGKK